MVVGQTAKRFLPGFAGVNALDQALDNETFTSAHPGVKVVAFRHTTIVMECHEFHELHPVRFFQTGCIVP
jgi:hypothetical protein